MVRDNLDRVADALVLFAWVLAAVLYEQIGPRVPIHWNYRGEVDGWVPRLPGVLAIPALMTGLRAFFATIPRISGVENDPVARRAAGAVTTSVLGLQFAVHVTILLCGMGVAVPMDRVISAAMGGVFLVVGAVMPDLPRKVKTERDARLAVLFRISGAGMVAIAALGLGMPVFTLAVLVTVAAAIGLSLPLGGR